MVSLLNIPAVVKILLIQEVIPSEILVLTRPGQLALTAALMPSAFNFLASFRVYKI